MRLTVYSLFVLLLLSSCSGNTKRVLVIAKGSIHINADTITIKDGGGTNEMPTDFAHEPKTLHLILKKDAGNVTIDIDSDGDGYFLLNGKNDTIIGSFQKYGMPSDTYTTVSQDALKRAIDSLQLLVQNKNVSPANRNYFILPYQAAKITNNLDAFMVTPYHRMTSIEKIGDKDPEVYRFWSIKEIRETIEKLKAMTVSKD